MAVSEKDNNSNCQQSGSIKDYHFYSQLSVAQSPDELKVAIGKALVSMGLDSFRFLAVGVDQPRQLSNWPEGLLALYEECHEVDLIAQQGATTTKPVYRSAVAEYLEQSPFQLESNDRFLAFCRQTAEYGCLDTYNITYKTLIDINFMFAVTKLGMEREPFQALVERYQPLIYLLGDIATSFAISRFGPFFLGTKVFMQRAGLTPKQLRLLEILAKDNVNLRGAADKMHISVDTANKHMAAIKLALGAKTQAAAVYRGIVTGLVDINSSDKWD